MGKGYTAYLVLPLLACLTLIAMYFFGPRWAQEIVAPKINREFGLLENLQLLLIVLIGLSANASRKITEGPKRSFFLTVAVASVFIFLEEIEYGLNFVEYYKGIGENDQAPIRSVHSIEGVTAIIKNLVYLGFGFCFIFITLIPSRIPAWLKPFLPTKKILLTILCLLIVSNTAWYINYVLKITGIESLYGNISEFEEVVIYYIFFLYLRELRQKELTTRAA